MRWTVTTTSPTGRVDYLSVEADDAAEAAQKALSTAPRGSTAGARPEKQEEPLATARRAGE